MPQQPAKPQFVISPTENPPVREGFLRIVGTSESVILCVELSLIYYLKGLEYERKNNIGNAEAAYLKALHHNSMFIDALSALMRIKKQSEDLDGYNKLLEKTIYIVKEEISMIEEKEFFKNYILSDDHFS